MIDAVMYGMIPSAKTANWESAPPEKMFRRLRIVPSCELKYSSIWAESTPGTGIQLPRR
jgi:hypothetical protein